MRCDDSAGLKAVGCVSSACYLVACAAAPVRRRSRSGLALLLHAMVADHGADLDCNGHVDGRREALTVEGGEAGSGPRDARMSHWELVAVDLGALFHECVALGVEAGEDVKDPSDGCVAEAFGGGVEGLLGKFCSSEVAGVVAAVEAAGGAKRPGDLRAAMDDLHVLLTQVMRLGFRCDESVYIDITRYFFMTTTY